MREIKFRVWTGHKMEYNVMAGFLGAFYVQGIDEKDSACMSTFNTKYHESAPLMQYTGTKDKHGTDIYEGDILRHDDGDLQEVNWPQNVWFTKQFTVVGNIYANPELVKIVNKNN